MNKQLLIIILLGIAGLMRPAGSRAEEAVKSYDTYKTVRTRNIFDPNRRAVRESTPTQRTSSYTPRTRSSTFTLTGTMVREGRSLAFFSGSRSEFSKVIAVGDAVANYKVTAIEPAQVELERDGKKMTLAIGKPFQIEGVPGDPEPAEEPAAAAGEPGAAAPGSTPPATTSTNPAPGGSDAKSEVLRRMMERRAKEMGQ